MNWASIRQNLGSTMAKLYLVSGTLHVLLFAGYLYQLPAIPASSAGPIQVQLAGGWTDSLMPKAEVPSKKPPHPSTPSMTAPTPDARHKASPPLQKNHLQKARSSVRQVNSARASLKPAKLPSTESGTLPTRKTQISRNGRPPRPVSTERVAATKPKTFAKTKAVSSKAPARTSPEPPKRPAPHSRPTFKKNGTPFHHTASAGQILNNRISAILSKIHREKRYPPLARERGIEGTATVAFQIKRDGHLGYLKLRKTSGNAALDRASLEAIRRAAPFPFVPRLLVLPIRYRLTEE